MNIQGVEVLSQTLNKNFTSSDAFLKNSIGSPVEIIPVSGSRTEGLLMDVNGSNISVKTSKGLIVFQRSQLLSFSLKSNNHHNINHIVSNVMQYHFSMQSKIVSGYEFKRIKHIYNHFGYLFCYTIETSLILYYTGKVLQQLRIECTFPTQFDSSRL